MGRRRMRAEERMEGVAGKGLSAPPGIAPSRSNGEVIERA